MAKCDCCGLNGPLFWHARCHTTAPMWVKQHQNGRLELVCAACGAHVAWLQREPPTDAIARDVLTWHGDQSKH